ncbi:helix-turn-helix domain-containing protein [Nocardia shimofusensis]|uniref:helix-turn-helix domain-containing protein n=1 Tax=Nocardia shimofusensis TaxID=228596 RepID=UPI000B27582E
MQVTWTGAQATALREALGLTQERFAQRSGIALSTVKKWAKLRAAITLSDKTVEIVTTMLERATPEQRARFAAATSIALLSTGTADSSVQWNPTVWTAAATAVADDLTREDLMIDRRQLSRTLFGVVVGTPLLEPLERWLAEPTRTVVPGTARPGVGLPEVAALENTARVFRAWDDQHGGGLRRKAVIGQLAEVNDLLTESHPPQIRRRLSSTMAQLAETAATMSWDCGEQHMAQRYYALAVRAARDADDRPFCAVVLAGMARQLLSLQQPADALELVRIAQDYAAGRMTSATEAMLYLREAWAYAKLGRPSAFRRTTEKARAVFDDADRTGDPYWIHYFDAAELTGTIGGRLLDIARTDPSFAGEAAEHIDLAIAVRPPGRRRSAALDHLNMVEARFIQREPEEACRIAHDALAVAEQTTSDRVAKKIATVYNRTGAYAMVPAVAELRERMRPLVTTSV